jgi:hypothetical protein
VETQRESKLINEYAALRGRLPDAAAASDFVRRFSYDDPEARDALSL